MEKNINKLNVRLALFALTVTLCAPLCAMSTLTTKLKSHLTNFKWTMKANTYKKSTILTDCTMSIFSKIGYKYLKYIQKDDPSLATKIITDKLTQIKNNIEQDRTKAINVLAKDYKITDKQLHSITLLIDEYKKCGKWYMEHHCENTEILNDESFPKEIIPILRKNNIKPNNVTLMTLPFNQGNTNADAYTITLENYNFFDALQNLANPNSYSFMPLPRVKLLPLVTLYSSYFNTSKTRQHGILIHEVNHIVNQDSMAQDYIVEGIHSLSQTPHEEIEANKNFKQLITNQERAAEILPAIKFKEDAAILRASRKESCYPKQLYGKHYFQLALIDTLHTLDKKLTE